MEDNDVSSNEMEDISLEEVLIQRKIPEETIKYFKDENIDTASLQLMEEEELTKWIPKFGDRITIRSFCKRKIAPKKLSLIQKLREKIAVKNKANFDEKKPKYKLKKHTRTVEVGWMCYNHKEKKLCQVRAASGGGTRKMNIEKSSSCIEVMELAKNLFFPNGISKKGSTENFQFELLDFQHNKINGDISIEDMFNITGLSKLRFYLATYPNKKDDLSDTDCEYEASCTIKEYSDVSSINDEPSTSSGVRHSTRSQGTSQELLSFINQFNLEDETLEFIYEPEENIYELPTECFSEKRLLILHRGHIFNELLDVFIDNNFEDFKNVKIEMILPNGESEKAADIGGVLRDALSEFWDSFYEKCTVGTNFKVPCVRHDFAEKEWKAAAKILLNGWENQKHFPIKLAPVFMANCLAPDDVGNDNEIIENFLEFVSESDRELLKNTLEDYKNTDYDDLVEFFGAYDSKRLPSNKEQFLHLLSEIAHTQLIQKPAFVANCFHEKLKGFIDKVNLKTIYNDLKPTAKNIISKIEINTDELTTNRRTVFEYLKKFIKEANENTRSAFLRFCTGSNLVNNQIKLHFSLSENVITRVPLAHTCNGILELPITYEDYVVFRNEFNSILNSNVWIMDIV